MRSWEHNASVDAQQTNKSDRVNRIYTDLDLFFTRKQSTSDVNQLYDVQAIKRSVRNLVLLNTHEKPFHPEISGGVREMLFHPVTPVVAQVISRKVEEVVEIYEPRVELLNVTVTPKYTENAFDVNIEFLILNAPERSETVEILLERLR